MCHRRDLIRFQSHRNQVNVMAVSTHLKHRAFFAANNLAKARERRDGIGEGTQFARRA